MTKVVVRRLGSRLAHIFQWLEEEAPYDELWDLCCDHGRLGLHIHQTQSNTRVHLVDVVPSIIDILQDKYKTLEDGRLFFKLASAEDISLADVQRQAIVIAGVGGATIIEILEGILRNNLALLENLRRLTHDNINQSTSGPCLGRPCLDLILSPNTHIFELRRYLKNSPFNLVKEAFVSERRYYHEHLFLRLGHQDQLGNTADDDILASDTGKSLWQPFTKEKKRYIEKRIMRYKNIKRVDELENAREAYQAYELLLENLMREN